MQHLTNTHLNEIGAHVHNIAKLSAWTHALAEIHALYYGSYPTVPSLRLASTKSYAQGCVKKTFTRG